MSQIGSTVGAWTRAFRGLFDGSAGYRTEWIGEGCWATPPDTMIIIGRNCRDLGRPGTVRALRDLISTKSINTWIQLNKIDFKGMGYNSG